MPELQHGFAPVIRGLVPHTDIGGSDFPVLDVDGITIRFALDSLAGLRVEDVIIAIDGTSLRELDYETIVDRLRGPAGSSVELDVFRDGEVITLVIMRQAYTR